MKHFIVYDTATGNVLRSGVSSKEDFSKQADPEKGEAVLEATADAIVVAEVNLDPVKQAMYRRIDTEASIVGSSLVPDPGRAMAYIYKAQEAAAYLANNGAPTPILAAEAQALGVSVATLAAEVVAASQAYTAVAAAIESTRRGAKKAVQEAQNVAAIHTAATINWQEVLSP